MVHRGQKLVDIIDKVPWYKSKLAIQRYLAEINKDKKVSVVLSCHTRTLRGQHKSLTSR
jgi:hypothetical protein